MAFTTDDLKLLRSLANEEIRRVALKLNTAKDVAESDFYRGVLLQLRSLVDKLSARRSEAGIEAALAAEEHELAEQFADGEDE